MELGLASLLRAMWIAGTLPILVAWIPYSRLSPLHGALLGFAKRGKIMQSSSHKFTVPQKFFMHFYMVAVMWTALLVLMTWFYAYRMGPLGSESLHYSTAASHLGGGSNIFSIHNSHSTPVEHGYMVWKAVFLLLLMEVQVLRRLYETVHVFNYSPSARMHIFGYLTGLFFYTAAPLSLCSICAPEVLSFAAHQVAEFVVKGGDHIPIIEFDWWAYLMPFTKLGWCQWIGAAIFIWGWIHQYRCHSILGSLRGHAEKSDEYVIPHGDWFGIVSCPHYLAEIIVYAGLLVASGGSDLTIWLVFGFVVSLLPLAYIIFGSFFRLLLNQYALPFILLNSKAFVLSGGRLQISFLQQQKLRGGISVNLRITHMIGMPFFPLFIKTDVTINYSILYKCVKHVQGFKEKI